MQRTAGQGQHERENDRSRLNAVYDKWMAHPLHAAFFEHSDFYNYGYSTAGTSGQREACENLVEKLLSFLPDKSGTLLDVACGMGASTRQLLRYYKPAELTGINISDWQLSRARQNAPGCRFLKMDASCMGFPDASFDNLLCVESAFHFDTRERFLQEAHRVLKPGGCLVLSDILGWQGKSKRANHLEDPAAYRVLLSRAGFQNYSVIDATEACTRACGRRLRRWPLVQYRAGRLGLREFVAAWLAANAYATFMRFSQRYYVLVIAQKAHA